MRLRVKTREGSKACLAVVGILLSIMGCTSAQEREKTEIWLIDPNSVVLYRVVSDEKELVIPIKSNPEMRKFMCISEDEMIRWIEKELEK